MRWMSAAVAAAALMLVAAGCGGSSSESSSAAAETTTSSETTGMETTATETESSESTTSEETGSTGSETTGLTGACKDLAEIGQKYSEALAKAGSGSDNDLGAAASAFSEFADQVPDEVKADFQTLADAFAVYAKALEGLDLKAGEVPSASQIAKLTEAAKSFNAGKVTQASANIEAWVTKNCGTSP
jgi:hypothetical protein